MSLSDRVVLSVVLAPFLPCADRCVLDAQMFEIMAFLVFGTIGVLADRYSSRRQYQPQT